MEDGVGGGEVLRWRLMLGNEAREGAGKKLDWEDLRDKRA
jgi:hypothetical protein